MLLLLASRSYVRMNPSGKLDGWSQLFSPTFVFEMAIVTSCFEYWKTKLFPNWNIIIISILNTKMIHVWYFYDFIPAARIFWTPEWQRTDKLWCKRLICILEFGYVEVDMFSEGVTFTNLGFVREFHGRAASATKHSLDFIFRVNSQ